MPAQGQGYHRPYSRGGEGSRGFRGRGDFRGGYNPRSFGGYEQHRGFRPQYFRGQSPNPGPPWGGMRGRGMRYGEPPAFGRGQYQYHQGPYKPRRQEGDDPFYHPSMFEDPWRFLLPKRERDKQEKAASANVGAKSNANEGGSNDNAEIMDASSGGGGIGKSEERTDITCASSGADDVEGVGDETAVIVDVKEDSGDGLERDGDATAASVDVKEDSGDGLERDGDATAASVDMKDERREDGSNMDSNSAEKVMGEGEVEGCEAEKQVMQEEGAQEEEREVMESEESKTGMEEN